MASVARVVVVTVCGGIVVVVMETAAKEGGGHFRGGWGISAIWAGEAGGGPLGPGLVARRRREKILA